MTDERYIYAVARIKAHENTLLTSAFMDSLLMTKSEDEALRMLSEKGWDTSLSEEEMLSKERKKTWDLMKEMLGDDIDKFGVFLYANDYHNLKAAIKAMYDDNVSQDIYIEDGTVDYKDIVRAISDRNYDALPDKMVKVAMQASDMILRTRDGQLCDITIDRAALVDMHKAAKATGEEILSMYGELTVVSSDIKMIIRAIKTGKDREFMMRALAPCDTLNIDMLMDAAISGGMESVYNYLSSTEYADAVDEIKKSMASFERWCDNLIIRRCKSQLYNSFGLGPLAAYVLAREYELKSIRIILSGKKNDFDTNSIRERVRETYV